jgi:hypothetical protein
LGERDHLPKHIGSSDQERTAWASNHAETFGAADMQRIHDTYEANEAKFLLDFVGRRFSANLPINEIFADEHWTQLFLGEGGIGGDVRCMFPGSDNAMTARVAKMHKGDIMTVTGTIEGHSHAINLDNCTIANPS